MVGSQGLRADSPRSRRYVPEKLCQVRKVGGSRGARRGAGGSSRCGIAAAQARFRRGDRKEEGEERAPFRLLAVLVGFSFGGSVTVLQNGRKPFQEPQQA